MKNLEHTLKQAVEYAKKFNTNRLGPHLRLTKDDITIISEFSWSAGFDEAKGIGFRYLIQLKVKDGSSNENWKNVAGFDTLILAREFINDFAQHVEKGKMRLVIQERKTP